MTLTRLPTLDTFEELLPDSRVEKLWVAVRRELGLPDEVSFATYIQPSEWMKNESGLEVLVPEQAFFIVVSPNPHPRHQGKAIKSFAFTPLTDWREAEDEAWRFAGAPDPALAIFRSLSRQHMETRRNYEELN